MKNSEQYPNQYKKCRQCGTDKLLSEFFRESANKQDGRRGTCKTCYDSSRRKYREENRIRMRERDRIKYESLSIEDKARFIKQKSEQNKLRFKTNPLALAKRREYQKTAKARYIMYRSESKRRSRNYEFTLTIEEFTHLLDQPCYICGKFAKDTENGLMGVDRLDNEIGYITDNCRPCCKPCNELKNTRSFDQVLSHVKTIVEHQKSIGNL